MGASVSVGLLPENLSDANKELIGKKLIEFTKNELNNNSDNNNNKLTEVEIGTKFLQSLDLDQLIKDNNNNKNTNINNNIGVINDSDIASPSRNTKPSSIISDMSANELETFEEENEHSDEEITIDANGILTRMKVDTRFKEENAFIRGRTSSQMLDEASVSMNESVDKINSFINDLKKGDVRQSKIEGGIRIRRLTSGTSIQEDTGIKSPVTKPKKVNSIGPRTTIFASTEIGVRQERSAPFIPEILGTFSCHGFEPSENSIDGIQQKINQDRGCVVYPFNAKQTDSLFIVLDGHGEQGDRVAEFTMRQIVISLEKHPKLISDPISALKESFVTTNTALMLTPIKYMTSGTTVVCVYITGNTLYIANVGDSRAVLAINNNNNSVHNSNNNENNNHTTVLDNQNINRYKAVMLSRDHKPDEPSEKARITQWGGFVQPSPEPGVTARVWLDKEYTHIGLAMSRSIGDHAVKNVGVIPEPDVFSHELQNEDKFLILASDGVWEFIENQEAVDIVQSNLHLGAYVACQILIQTAAQRWSIEEGDYRDDITAIVVQLPLPFQSI